MAEQNTMKILISTFVVLLLALAFVVSIADQTSNATEKTQVLLESHDATTCFVSDGTDDQVNEGDAACVLTLTNAPTSWKIEDCPLAEVVVTNGTAVDVWTVDTDYTLSASAGTITLLNTTATEHVNGETNNTVTSYTYCGDSYMNASWGRNILGVNVGIYALAILLVAIGAAYLLLRD